MIGSWEAVGRLRVVGDRTIAAVARTHVVRWPGGVWLRSRPAAVVVETEGGTERIPIPNRSTRIRWAIGVGTAALIVVIIAGARRRRISND